MVIDKHYKIYDKYSLSNTYSILLEQKKIHKSLLFENQAVAVLSMNETEATKWQFKHVCDAYACLGVLNIALGDEEQVQYLVLVTGCMSQGKLNNSEIIRITDTNFISLRNVAQDLEFIQEVRKLLNSGIFYFPWVAPPGQPNDLSLCAQRGRHSLQPDSRFFWSRLLHVHLRRFGIECSEWLVNIMCGAVVIRTLYLGNLQARLAIISRLSCEGAGSRFNVRGTNDEGHVANFIETEQAIYVGNKVTSFIQARGFVPLFWEQTGLQLGMHRVKSTRGKEASEPAFERHLNLLQKRYKEIVFLDLLGSKEGEISLSTQFQSQIRASKYAHFPYITFDYQTQSRSGRHECLFYLKQKVFSYLRDFDFFFSESHSIVRQQKGIFRAHSLDCLERTNSVQMHIGLEILIFQITALGEKQKSIFTKFEEAFRQLWTRNGDLISQVYSYTGVLEKKQKMKEYPRAGLKTYSNNILQDNSKQGAIDLLLHGTSFTSDQDYKARCLLPLQALHLFPRVSKRMLQRCAEFTETVNLSVGVATWNVNGGKHITSQTFQLPPMKEWLLDNTTLQKFRSPAEIPNGESRRQDFDIYAVGFEEIVDLNATNIVSPSTANQSEWGVELQQVLSQDEKFVLVTSTQLVGVCLFIFIKDSLVQYVRDVAWYVVKTGLGGAAGNKGAVAIRLLIHATSICFICAHFAHGQYQWPERNTEYNEVSRKICFPMNRALNSHDYIFWCGDFNYRIDLPQEIVKELVKKQDWNTLKDADQLILQQRAGNVFKNFIEGPLTFPPTYKFDIFSDEYDSSEKNRIPSWTDRILFRRRRSPLEVKDLFWNPGTISHYWTADLKASDHRPVAARIEVQTKRVDELRRSIVLHEMLEEIGPLDASIIVGNKNIKNEKMAYKVFNDDFITELVTTLSKSGEVLLVKFNKESLVITFREGQSALNALKVSGSSVRGVHIEISLKTSNWIKKIEDELKLCETHIVPLYHLFSTSSESSTLFHHEYKIHANNENYPEIKPPPKPLRYPNPIRRSPMSTPTSSQSPPTSSSSSLQPSQHLRQSSKDRGSGPLQENKIDSDIFNITDILIDVSSSPFNTISSKLSDNTFSPLSGSTPKDSDLFCSNTLIEKHQETKEVTPPYPAIRSEPPTSRNSISEIIPPPIPLRRSSKTQSRTIRSEVALTFSGSEAVNPNNFKQIVNLPKESTPLASSVIPYLPNPKPLEDSDNQSRFTRSEDVFFRPKSQISPFSDQILSEKKDFGLCQLPSSFSQNAVPTFLSNTSSKQENHQPDRERSDSIFSVSPKEFINNFMADHLGKNKDLSLSPKPLLSPKVTINPSSSSPFVLFTKTAENKTRSQEERQLNASERSTSIYKDENNTLVPKPKCSDVSKQIERKVNLLDDIFESLSIPKVNIPGEHWDSLTDKPRARSAGRNQSPSPGRAPVPPPVPRRRSKPLVPPPIPARRKLQPPPVPRRKVKYQPLSTDAEKTAPIE